jgi:hypothetical protein
MAAVHVTVAHHVRILTIRIRLVKKKSRGERSFCCGRLDYGDKGMTGFVALFWKTIRPCAALTRLMGTNVLTGLP